jgi:hypothetical protein
MMNLTTEKKVIMSIKSCMTMSIKISGRGFSSLDRRVSDSESDALIIHWGNAMFMIKLMLSLEIRPRQKINSIP